MKKEVMLVAIAAVFLTSGCATIFKSSRETVTITTDTPTTNVYINGAYMGLAPLRVALKPTKNHVISLQNSCYSTRHFVLGHKVHAGWVLLSVFGSVTSLFIDALTGAWNTFNTNHVHVRMRTLCGISYMCQRTSSYTTATCSGY